METNSNYSPWVWQRVRDEVKRKQAKLRRTKLSEVKEFLTCGDYGIYGVSLYHIDHKTRLITSITPYGTAYKTHLTEDEYNSFTLGNVITKCGTLKESISKISFLAPN